MRRYPRLVSARRWGLAVWLLAALAVVSWAPASALASAPAHAELRSVTPADGATLATPPAQLVLVFGEDVNPAFVQVALTRDGIPVALAAPSVTSGTVTATVPAGSDVGAGGYRIAYRVVSVDGHPVSGASQFTVTGPAAAGTSPATSAATSSQATSASTSGPAGPSTASASAGPLIATTPASPAESSPNTALLVGAALLVILAGFAGLLWYRRRHAVAPTS
ncbi:MAG: copper resistance CopC family protein [Dermatophilaceae bacterium]